MEKIEKTEKTKNRTFIRKNRRAKKLEKIAIEKLGLS